MKYALALIAICVASSAGLAHTFKCVGTEPFWSLAIDDRQIRFSTPEKSTDLMPTAPRSARGMAEDYVLVYTTHMSADKNEPATIVLQKSPTAQCSDGMSDTSYPYHGVLITRQAVYSGCCRKDQPTSSNSD